MGLFRKTFLTVAALAIAGHASAQTEYTTAFEIKNPTRAEILDRLRDTVDADQPRLVDQTEARGRVSLGFGSPLDLPVNNALDFVISNPSLLNDAEIGAQVRLIAEHHPVASARTMARLALSGLPWPEEPYYLLNGGFNDRLPEAYRGFSAEITQAEEQHCPPTEMAVEFDWIWPEGAEQRFRNRSFKVRAGRGHLAGGGYSIQGRGLQYVPDAEGDRPLDTRQTISRDNVFIVVPSLTPGEFWAIDGPHHMIGGGAIWKVVLTEDGIFTRPHRTLPKGVAEVYRYPDGSVFIAFEAWDESERGGIVFDGETRPFKLSRSNPPIRLHPDGRMSKACDPDAPVWPAHTSDQPTPVEP